MVLTFLHVLLASLSLFSISSSTSEFTETNAQKMIRALNLFPELEVNIVKEKTNDKTPKLVEKSFRFPYLQSANGNGTSIQDFGHHAGYYKLPHSKDARMFYFFFESRNNTNTDPLIVWLTGGPGCSGSLALFYENGPFHLTKNLSLQWNEFGWDKVSNLIYVDQPTGTGFSYTSDESDIRTSSEAAGADFYDFLQAFLEKHPQYAKHDFYITGESYAGHYIPAFAAQINKKNKIKQGIHINLKGLAIGNGITNPAIQYEAYPDYALQTKLIDRSTFNEIKSLVPTCEQEIKTCAKNSDDCPFGYSQCNQIFEEIISSTDGVNYYDIRKKCEGSLCYDFSSAENFLNTKSVKEALGVGDIKFVSCSSVVHNAMINDALKNFEVGLPQLLEDRIKLLIYAGEYDLICNWLGNSRWVDAMVWSGQKNYLSSASTPFVVDGVKSGESKSSGPLTFLKVYNAGHLVPMDQPKAALEMLRRWIRVGKLE